jgi:putative addiction module component (TIGR02574 family)
MIRNVGGAAMTKETTELLAEALKLPETEREELADRLLESLDPPTSDIDQMTDEEFVAELDRRAVELRQNPELGIPWDEVKKMS